jgi:hypothetical protein
MASALHPPAIKLVGSNGQISLGKQYAGRHVLVEESEPGVWIVRTATVIPDNERWLHEPAAAASLQAAMAWSASHPPADSDLDESLKCLGRDEAWRPHQAGSEQPGVSALDTLNKIRQLTWNQLYRDLGIKWEKITSIKPPAGIDAVYSLRISRSRRATAHREGEYMRLLTIAPDHDATYGRKWFISFRLQQTAPQFDS